MKIYLAGALTGISFDEANTWREDVQSRIEEITYYSGEIKCQVINPVALYNYQNPKHKTEREVMQYDLNHVRSSDLIIVTLKNINTSIGTAIELYLATQLNIPVLAFGSFDEYESTHPWIKECISRYDETIEDTLDYISEFYFSGASRKEF